MNTLATLRGTALLFAAVGGAAFATLAWRARASFSWFERARAHLYRDLTFIRAPVTAERVLAAQLGSCVLGIAAARALQAPWPLLLTCAAACLPARWLSQLRAARIAAIEGQLDPFLVALANTLRAVPSLGEALASSTATTAPPLRDEIDLLLKEYRLGTPLDRALDDAARRIESRAFTALVLTLGVARTAGGGVSECLERAAATLREMLRLDGVVRTKTAEGKTQAWVISVLPGPFFILLSQIDPDFLQPLAATAKGNAVMAVAAVMWLVAVVAARRIVQVDL